MIYRYTVAYLGLHFGGGGVQIVLEKWRYLNGASRHAARGKATRLLRGSGACSPEKIFKNCAIWCVLKSILQNFLSKNNLKYSLFLYKFKIIDNVLLRTIYRGIAAYSPDFLSPVRFGVSWSTVSVNFLLRKYFNYL